MTLYAINLLYVIWYGINVTFHMTVWAKSQGINWQGLGLKKGYQISFSSYSNRKRASDPFLCILFQNLWEYPHLTPLPTGTSVYMFFSYHSLCSTCRIQLCSFSFLSIFVAFNSICFFHPIFELGTE